MGLWDDIELEKFKRCADTYLSCQGLKRLQAFTRSMVVIYSLMSKLVDVIDSRCGQTLVVGMVLAQQ